MALSFSLTHAAISSRRRRISLLRYGPLRYDSLMPHCRTVRRFIAGFRLRLRYAFRRDFSLRFRYYYMIC